MVQIVVSLIAAAASLAVALITIRFRRENAAQHDDVSTNLTTLSMIVQAGFAENAEGHTVLNAAVKNMHDRLYRHITDETPVLDRIAATLPPPPEPVDNRDDGAGEVTGYAAPPDAT